MSVTIFSIWLSLEVIAVVVSLCGNSVVIYVMMSSDRRLRNKTSFYITSIAIADLLSSVFVAVLTTNRSILFWNPTVAINPTLCLLLASSLMVLTTVSFLHLLAVSVDRFWAICFPISYFAKTANSTKPIIGVLWVVGTIIGLTPLLQDWRGQNCALHFLHYFIQSLLAICSAVVVIVLYSMIYRALLKQVINFNDFNANCN